MIVPENQSTTGTLPDGMTGTLEVMAAATNYRDWLIRESASHIQGHVLEIGSGMGTMTDCFDNAESVMGIEFDDSYIAAMKSRFADRTDITIRQGDAADVKLMSALEKPFDSAFSFNVFEHIEDDLGAMRGVFAALRPGGRFVCFVPAGPSIYGTLDHNLGHQRRYTRKGLIAVAREAGFTVVDAYYFNLIGYFAWGFMSKILRLSELEEQSGNVGIYDRVVVPLAAAVQRLGHPPFGQSLFLVADRPS